MEANNSSLIKAGTKLLEGKLIVLGRSDLPRKNGPPLRQWRVRWRDCGHERQFLPSELLRQTECGRCRQQEIAGKQTCHPTLAELKEIATRYQRHCRHCLNLGADVQPLERFITEQLEMLRLEAQLPEPAHYEPAYERRDWAAQLYTNAA